MKINYRSLFTYTGLAIAILFLGVYTYSRVSRITDYPFTTSWSESGRIFNAFQVYSGLITGKQLPWPWLDPGRSILDGLVLLLPNRQIGMYHLWGLVLYLIFSIATSIAVARKAWLASPWYRERSAKGILWLLMPWGVFFLLQGPVYYHVLLGVIALLWFYDAQKPLLVLVLVILGSAWEGLCRVNWFLMPAFIAILLHVLGKPFTGRRLWDYVRWPVAYLVAGGLASGVSYLIFIKATGYIIPFLDARMHYAYFLYKLWPNAGFIGLIPGIIARVALLFAFLIFAIWKSRRQIHSARILIIFAILAIFFAGSTLVSIRAGGGYDFHNYDSFLLLLLICGCFFELNAVTPDGQISLEKVPLVNFAFLLGLIILSMAFLYHPSQPVQQPGIVQSNAAIQEIKSVVDSVGKGDRPVLFMDQKQLLVFQIIQQTQIYASYDKIELMEMAMARNEEYQKKFAADIKDQKFSYIVSEILQIWPKHFDRNNIQRDWYENNVWVEMVAQPVLASYEPIYVNKDLGFAIYAPK